MLGESDQSSPVCSWKTSSSVLEYLYLIRKVAKKQRESEYSQKLFCKHLITSPDAELRFEKDFQRNPPETRVRFTVSTERELRKGGGLLSWSMCCCICSPWQELVARRAEKMICPNGGGSRLWYRFERPLEWGPDELMAWLKKRGNRVQALWSWVNRKQWDHIMSSSFRGTNKRPRLATWHH